MEDLTKQLIARLDGYEGNSAGREDFIDVIADARRDAAITSRESIFVSGATKGDDEDCFICYAVCVRIRRCSYVCASSLSLH
mmetsp:Transcript_37013/g.75449  ORF Transcript_37013/g.75449 Transcript_37013/m.75449 type:complete len:82 (-) Transcript_37013:115-360(-)